jgi:hypothetical protein
MRKVSRPGHAPTTALVTSTGISTVENGRPSGTSGWSANRPPTASRATRTAKPYRTVGVGLESKSKRKRMIQIIGLIRTEDEGMQEIPDGSEAKTRAGWAE